MTVTANVVKSGPYNGNGSTDEFDYDFKVDDKTHLLVILTDANDSEEELTVDTDYTVNNVGNEDGGTITMVTPPATGEKLTIKLDMPFVQETELTNQGPFLSEQVEEALDYLTRLAQQNSEEISRAVKTDISSSVTADELIDELLEAASDAVDAAAAAATSQTAAAASASSASTSATSASTSATNAATSATNAATSATAAQTAETNAETAEANAEAAQAAAETAETNAETAATNAASSASSASTSATNAATSATNAATSATAAASSATAAAASYDSFDDRYLGSKTSDPTLDNDGNALLEGALYWNSVDNVLKVYDGAAWQVAGGASSVIRFLYIATASQTTFSGVDEEGLTLAYQPGALEVFVNGVLQLPDDYTATDGSSVVFDTGLTVSDEVQIITFNTYTVVDPEIVLLDDAQTITNKQIENSELIDTAVLVHDLGSISGTLAIDYTNGHVQTGTVTGNITLSNTSISNWPASGKHGALTLKFTIGGAGGYTLTLGSRFKKVGGATITLSTTVGARDVLKIETEDAGAAIMDIYQALNMS